MQPCCGWKQHWISDQDKENIHLWSICVYWILVNLVYKLLLPFYWYRHIRVQLPCNQISCLLSHYVPTGKGEEVTKVYSRALHPYLALITVWTVALWWPNRSDRIGSLWWSIFIFDRSIRKGKTTHILKLPQSCAALKAYQCKWQQDRSQTAMWEGKQTA